MVLELNVQFAEILDRLKALTSSWFTDEAIAAMLSGPEPVLLLADDLLAQLPLECKPASCAHCVIIYFIDALSRCCCRVMMCAALPVLEGKSALSRDFSLHVTAARAKALRYAEADFVVGLGTHAFVDVLLCMCMFSDVECIVALDMHYL